MIFFLFSKGLCSQQRIPRHSGVPQPPGRNRSAVQPFPPGEQRALPAQPAQDKTASAEQVSGEADGNRPHRRPLSVGGAAAAADGHVYLTGA